MGGFTWVRWRTTSRAVGCVAASKAFTVLNGNLALLHRVSETKKLKREFSVLSLTLTQFDSDFRQAGYPSIIDQMSQQLCIIKLRIILISNPG